MRGGVFSKRLYLGLMIGANRQIVNKIKGSGAILSLKTGREGRRVRWMMTEDW